jgi:hypothetical protein
MTVESRACRGFSLQLGSCELASTARFGFFGGGALGAQMRNGSNK